MSHDQEECVLINVKLVQYQRNLPTLLANDKECGYPHWHRKQLPEQDTDIADTKIGS